MRQWTSFYVYTKPDPEDAHGEGANLSYENTVVFIIANFQYLITCVSFSISRPFRKPLYTNVIFTVSIMIMIAFSSFILMSDELWLTDFFDLREEGMPMQFRLWLAVLVFANFVVTYVFEKLGIWYLALWWKRRSDRNSKRLQDLDILQSEEETDQI